MRTTAFEHELLFRKYWSELEKFNFSPEIISVDHWINVPQNLCHKYRSDNANLYDRLNSDDCCVLHFQVSLARLQNGQEYRLDGRSRAFFWEKHAELKAKVPNQELLATVYPVKTFKEAWDLWNLLTSPIGPKKRHYPPEVLKKSATFWRATLKKK